MVSRGKVKNNFGENNITEHFTQSVGKNFYALNTIQI